MFVYLSFTMVRELSLVKTPSMINLYPHRATPSHERAIIVASLLWIMLVDKRRGGYSQSPMFIRSVSVCYKLPSFLDTRTDWISMPLSFCLRNHFLVLCNSFFVPYNFLQCYVGLLILIEKNRDKISPIDHTLPVSAGLSRYRTEFGASSLEP